MSEKETQARQPVAFTVGAEHYALSDQAGAQARRQAADTADLVAQVAGLDALDRGYTPGSEDQRKPQVRASRNRLFCLARPSGGDHSWYGGADHETRARRVLVVSFAAGRETVISLEQQGVSRCSS
jgi:hypothetical protein